MSSIDKKNCNHKQDIKHLFWDYDKVRKIYKFIIELFKDEKVNVTYETVFTCSIAKPT